jgi:hypothetical protein
VRRLLHEPLLHFLLLGALLFGLYGWLNSTAQQAPDEIVLTRGQLHSLQAQFRRTWQRPPRPEELQALVDSWVREEIFYREGLAMGLDRDDPVVRRRVAQKLEFIADDSGAAAPTDAELQAWLDAHAERYRVEPRYTLSQLYFDAARHGDRLYAELARARRALDQGRAAEGDATLLPPALQRATATQVQRIFGESFAEALAALPVDSWHGPVRSTFGVHLVRLSASEPARPATLAEARAEAESDFLQHRAARASAARYQALRARYAVRVDAAATTAQ